MKRQALLMALSDKVANDCLVVLDKLEMQEFKTKVFKSIIEKLEKQAVKAENKKPSWLIMVDQADEKLNYSARNLTGVKLINLDNINLVDLLKYKDLLLTKATVEKLEQKYK